MPRRVVVEASTFTLEDKAKAEAVLRKAGHVMLDCPVSGTGAQAKVRDLVVYASGGAAEIKRLRPMFAGFTRAVHDLGAFGNGSRMKYVANLSGRHPQRGERRGDGAGHEGRAAAAADLRSGQDRRRQFARVRVARADDGEGSLRRTPR